jgi:hypothetical protein
MTFMSAPQQEQLFWVFIFVIIGSKHILPKGLMRIRHYGTMANRNRQRTRRLILTALELKEEETVDKDKQITVQEPAYYSPSCGGHHIRVSAITQKEVKILIEPG